MTALAAEGGSSGSDVAIDLPGWSRGGPPGIGLNDGGCGHVAFVDRDVEAGLLEFLFNVDFAGSLQGAEPGAHPTDFLTGEAFLGNVNGGAGEVWAGDVSLRGRGIAVYVHEMALVGDGSDGGGDFQRAVKLGFVGARQIYQKAGCPGAAVTMMLGQVSIYGKRCRRGDGDQGAAGDAIGEVIFVLDAFQAFGVGFLVLTRKGLEGTAHGRRNRHAFAAQ